MHLLVHVTWNLGNVLFWDPAGSQYSALSFGLWIFPSPFHLHRSLFWPCFTGRWSPSDGEHGCVFAGLVFNYGCRGRESIWPSVSDESPRRWSHDPTSSSEGAWAVGSLAIWNHGEWSGLLWPCLEGILKEGTRTIRETEIGEQVMMIQCVSC